MIQRLGSAFLRDVLLLFDKTLHNLKPATIMDDDFLQGFGPPGALVSLSIFTDYVLV